MRTLATRSVSFVGERMVQTPIGTLTLTDEGVVFDPLPTAEPTQELVQDILRHSVRADFFVPRRSILTLVRYGEIHPAHPSTEGVIDVSRFMPTDGTTARQTAVTGTIATMAGSRILAAAADARAARASGIEIGDLTVGDYDPGQYRAPHTFLRILTREIDTGRNQYPPSDGLPELQASVLSLYEERLGIRFPSRSVVICGGARPPIYAVFRTLVGPGDKVVYPVPSWNNDYYCALTGATQVPIRTVPESNFMPTVADIEAHLSDPATRLVCINSPLNPCGTVISEDVLRGICQAIVDENIRRAASGTRPVFLLFDQVYWPLVYGDARHVHPIGLVPEIAPHVLYVDAISKWLVGTGLRLGWVVVPTYLYEPIRDFMGHVGGWAPRPVQAATATYLIDRTDLEHFHRGLRSELDQRLTLVREAFEAMRAEGLPVEVLRPEGAIYASVRFDILGYRTQAGTVLRTNDDIRRYLLQEARVALVAFQAFGLPEDTGWFRLSVGAVGSESLSEALHRVAEAVRILRRE